MAVIIASLFIAIAATFAGYFATWVLSRFTSGLVKKPATG
jgi:FlaG/FlaF family flagellin (archaellin)